MLVALGWFYGSNLPPLLEVPRNWCLGKFTTRWLVEMPQSLPGCYYPVHKHQQPFYVVSQQFSSTDESIDEAVKTLLSPLQVSVYSLDRWYSRFALIELQYRSIIQVYYTFIIVLIFY